MSLATRSALRATPLAIWVAVAAVGVVGAAITLALILRGMPLYMLLTPLACGIVVGGIVGWRVPTPGSAVWLGVIAGALTGALLMLSAFVALSLLGAPPNMPPGLTRVLRLSDSRARLLTALLGISCLPLCAVVGGWVGGLASAWRGYPGSEIEAMEGAHEEEDGPLTPPGPVEPTGPRLA